MRERFKADAIFRSQVAYAVEHGIPYSIYLGRVVGDDEPYWLPEDRDIITIWDEFERARYICGHWKWEWDDLTDHEIDYDVCRICQSIDQRADEVRVSRKDMYGVSFAFYPSSENDDRQGDHHRH